MLRQRAARGYALPLVLAILVVIAAALGILLTVLSSSAHISGDMIQRRKAFYACDGIQRAIVQLGNDYLRTDPTPTPAEMDASIKSAGGGAALPGITPANFTVTKFTVNFDAAAINTGPLPNGAFAGMNAKQLLAEIEVEAELDNTAVRCGQQLDVSLGKISLFQFFVFSDVDYSDWSPGQPSTIGGRSHFNGRFCASGKLNLDVVTAAGEFYSAEGEANCRVDKGDEVFIFDGVPALVDFLPAADHGCVNCDGTGLDWKDYATATWDGNVQDIDHDVPVLRPPVAGQTETQAGIDADGALISNAGGMRFLVDPPRLGTDDADVLAQKYACKADLRIVNGVWYLRDPGSGDGCGGWPGIPIYSDHAGRYTTSNAEFIEGTQAVGQRDLFDDASTNWSARTPPGSPQRYSYYYSDPAPATPSSALAYTPGNPAAVISYGTLFRQAAGPVWVPGPVVDQNAVGTICSGACGAAPVIRAFTDVTIGDQPAALLAATRSGFRDHQIETVGSPALADVLPMNFDVAAFQAALLDTTEGELGDVFVRAGRAFNGIVYISSLWPGQMTGFPNAAPAPPPPQGGDNVTGGPGQNQVIAADIAAVNTGVPFPLCAGTGTDLVDFATNIGLQLCAAPPPPSFPMTPTAAGYPSVVRIINASNTTAAALPIGLSIVTNLPIWMVGDVNTSSTPGGAPWIPVMMGGDVGGFLSSAWDDNRAKWELSDGDGVGVRPAAVTTYNLELIAGWATTTTTPTYSGGIENFPRYLEAWGGLDHFLNGSIVVGFRPTLRRVQHGTSSGDFRSPPSRSWTFDTNLNVITNQPPGAPVFDVSAVRKWRRF